MISSGGASLRSWHQLCMCCSSNIAHDVLYHTDHVHFWVSPTTLHWLACLTGTKMPSTKKQQQKTTKAEAASTVVRLTLSQALSLAVPWFFISFSSLALAMIILSHWICWLSLDWLSCHYHCSNLRWIRDSGQMLPNRAYTEFDDRAFTVLVKLIELSHAVLHKGWINT